MATEHYLTGAKDRSIDTAVDLDRAVRFDIAADVHARGDDRKRRFRRAAAYVDLVVVLSEQCHESPTGQCAVVLDALLVVGPGFGGDLAAVGAVRVEALSICCT